MPDFIVPLLIVLCVVTLVGHLIWVMLAAIFRAIAGAVADDATENAVRCPVCGTRNPAARQRCQSCNQPLSSPRPRNWPT